MKKLPLTLATAGLLMLSQPAAAAARVAVAHFAPFASSIDDTAVDIAVNGTIALEDVKFKVFTEYLEFEAGDYTIDVYLADTFGMADPVISREFALVDGNDYTVFASGNASTQDLELNALLDNTTDPMTGNLNIRVVHTAPFSMDLAATEVSIRTAGGDVVNGLVGVPYGVASPFFEIPAGNYDLKVASNDGSVNYIDPLPADLPAGADVTIYAVGDGINQPLGIVAFPVGELMTRTPVDNRSNGMWMIQEGSGTGFVFQPMPSQNRAVGTWYTYDMEGNPTFLTFDSCDTVPDGMGGEGCLTPGAFDGKMATTALYTSSGGGPGEGDMVETVKVGEIDFEILNCDEATATVRLDNAEPMMYTATQLTRPFPCTDVQ
ncbi:MAG: DUF4397 domain-containing protein [Xanthomonadales bacterium]|jgi:hypothetical protein|nr:DUF4397 domain-containing protein [Xanthomonadales bacterium]